MIEMKVFIKNEKEISRMIGTNVRKATEEAMMYAMRRSVIRLADYIAEEKLSGKKLNVRTGNLRRSFQENKARKVQRRADGVIGTVGTNVKYAKIQEYGGTIRPKKKKWLTVPIGEALTPSGAPRGSARDFKGTFFAWSRKGNLILFGQSPVGGGKKIVPLFVLKKMVRIPGRAYMKPSLEELRDDIVKFFCADIKKQIGEIWGRA